MTFEEFIENIFSQNNVLESENLTKTIQEIFPIAGNNLVENISFKKHNSQNYVSEKGVLNSPPQEGCPKDGVDEETVAEFDTSSPKKPYRIIKIHEFVINLTPILNLPYNANLGERAKKLRKAGNLPEVLFWMQVTKGNFHKIDFDRQRVIGNYIVDFYIKKLGLVVEIDGSSHDNKQDYDAIREAFLVSLGLKVYRIKVVEVMRNMNSVITNLENYIIENYGELSNNKPPRQPLADTPPMEGVLGRVYINENQYFENIPEIIWDYKIDNCFPVQKWLINFLNKKLQNDDILRFYKIIVAQKRL